MKRFQYLQFSLSILGLVVGCGAVGISLMLASQVSSHEATRLTARELYWGEPLLPDHIFYPAMMAVDRVQLEQANATERVYMQVVYAGRRLGYAEELFARGKEDLALTTLTKSQKYLLHAGQEALSGSAEHQQSLAPYLLKAFAFHERELLELAEQHPSANWAPVQQLLNDSEHVHQQLQQLVQ